MSQTTILVADDDGHIREVVRFAMVQAGFTVLEARDGREALARATEGDLALVILDIMMPEMDGTEVCRELRRTSEVPVIFLTSRDDEIDRVVGLELGGDDYVTKPFSPRELVARVRAVLRRTRAARTASDPKAVPEPARRLAHGRLELDLDLHKAYWSGRQVELTVTEFGVVRTLLGFPGKVFSREELMEGMYKDHTIVSARTVDSHVTRVRKKFERLGAHFIETVHGVGYKLT
ncbi:MAG: response regulator transcription factor [Myxococcota bacterium]